jgi:hypothetical protein
MAQMSLFLTLGNKDLANRDISYQHEQDFSSHTTLLK